MVVGEEQVVGGQVAFGDVGLDLEGEVEGELEPPVLLVLGVVLDEEAAALGWNFGVILPGGDGQLVAFGGPAGGGLPAPAEPVQQGTDGLQRPPTPVGRYA
ncbi:hypothetical protein GCM10023259_100770 [Thermocatellispora tengchongensis]